MIEVNVSEQKTDEVEQLKYPYIGIMETGTIVLFTKPETGIILRTATNKMPTKYLSSSYICGDFSSDFDEELFKPFNGEITLRNE